MTSPNTQNLNSNQQNNSNPTDPQNQNQFSNQSQSPIQQISNTQNPGGGQSSNPQDINAQIYQSLNTLGEELRQLRSDNQMLQLQIQTQRAGYPQQNISQQQQDNFQVPGKDEFWENPGDATRRVVENLMQRSLQPIQSGINFFMNQQQYQTAKARMKLIPQFSGLNAVEDIFDTIISQALNAGNALSDGLLLTSYHTAVGLGMQQGRFNQQQQVVNNPQNQQFNQQPQGNYQSNPYVMGQQQNNQQQFQQPQNQQRQNNVVTPPYLQTNAQNQNQQGSIKLRDLNENEETVRKQGRMTHAEFLFYGEEISEDLFKAADPQAHERYTKKGRR